MQKFQNMENSNSRTFQGLSRAWIFSKIQGLSRTSQGPYEPCEEHPRWQVNRVQIRAIRWKKCLAQWTEGSHACKFLCFWRCEREHSPAAVTIYNGHISPWCRVASLCQAPRHMVLSAWLNKNDFCIAHVQHCDGHRSTAAGIFALALPDFWRWCFSWEQLMSKCGHSYIIN